MSPGRAQGPGSDGASGHANAHAHARPTVWASLCTPLTGRDAAIACIDLTATSAPALDALLLALTGSRTTIPSGRAPLRTVVTPQREPIDEVVLARWSETHATIMPHAGPAAIRLTLEACAAAGAVVYEPASEPGRRAGARPLQAAPRPFPEARDALERRLLMALATLASDRAIEPLLDQTRRWHLAGLEAAQASLDAPALSAALDKLDASETSDQRLHRWRQLNHLIHPALVVCVGPPNIGKSSLLNALAGARLSAVADEPGTTRDTVGAKLNLGGLVVRWADAPGLLPRRAQRQSDTSEPADPDEQAQFAARSLISRADLLIVCEEPAGRGRDAPHWHPRGARSWPDQLSELKPTSSAIPRIRARLRVDLEAPDATSDPGVLRVSSKLGTGLTDLARAVSEALVPQRLIDDPRPWVWW